MGKKKQFTCKECNLSYTFSQGLRAHIRTKHSGEEYICHQCEGGRHYKSKCTLVNHIRKVHEGRRPHTCTYCEAAFYGSGELAIHVRKEHTGERPFKCSHCQKSFTANETLLKHLKIHLGIKPHACTHCNKTFVTARELRSHLLRHTGEKPFPCNQCGKYFRHRQGLRRHTMSHSGERPHSCTYCSRRFQTARDLTYHTRTHTGEKPFKCSHCAAYFATESNLAKHYGTCHTNDRPFFTCSTCHKSFFQKISLTKHIRREHLHKGDDVNCEICGEQVASLDSLREHKRTQHPPARRFSCYFCYKAFGIQQNLMAHIQSHTGEKPFTCNTCGKSYTRKACLTQHEEMHQTTRARPCMCEWCSKKFYNKYKLKRHSSTCKASQTYKEKVAQMLHQNKETGEHDFFCDVCARPLTSYSRFTAHMKTHDDKRDKPFGCQKFGKRNFHKNHLERHISESSNCNILAKSPGIRPQIIARRNLPELRVNLYRMQNTSIYC